jgi:hypothetical protein
MNERSREMKHVAATKKFDHKITNRLDIVVDGFKRIEVFEQTFETIGGQRALSRCGSHLYLVDSERSGGSSEQGDLKFHKKPVKNSKYFMNFKSSPSLDIKKTSRRIRRATSVRKQCARVVPVVVRFTIHGFQESTFIR